MFFLDGSIDNDLLLHRGCAMHFDGCGQNALQALGAGALAEANHVGRSHRRLPLEYRFAREVLGIRVLHLSLDHGLVAQIEHMLLEVQAHYESNRFGGVAGIRVRRTQFCLNFCPVYFSASGQSEFLGLHITRRRGSRNCN